MRTTQQRMETTDVLLSVDQWAGSGPPQGTELKKRN
jgi:hypothetical protein